MDLIVTHINADFDALASMVAAKKLYPQSRLLLPGSQERAVRKFLSLCRDLIEVEGERECSLEDIDRLIMVETRLASRIGKAQQLVGKKGIQIHIYDHHPRTKDDMKAQKDIFREVGATVTILVDIIKNENLYISPLEATVMTLGIYEDTGSLLFPTTTRYDVDAVGYLLDRGANLNVVNQYLKEELQPEELSMLAYLLKSTEKYNIKGIEIAVATCQARDYHGELSLLAHKLMEVENFSVVFLLAKMDGRIRLIARSHTPSVDVAKVTEALDGGGHPTAASGTLRGASLNEAKVKLLKYLKKHARPSPCARDIMISPVLTVSPRQSVHYARKVMVESELSGLPVVERTKLKGIITLRVADRLLRQGIAHSKIKGHMSKEFFPISPKTGLDQIRKVLFEKKVGQLPVMEGKRLIGMVTRTEILRTIHGGLEPKGRAFEPGVGPGGDAVPKSGIRPADLSRRMKSSLPRSIVEILKFIGRQASSIGSQAFVVGGFVRDLLLGEENFDLDIVLEGDAIEFARGLAKKTGGAHVIHKRFGTATVVIDWPMLKGLGKSPAHSKKFKIDMATARREYYERPAALPRVEFSLIREDLYRRDFTINAMAVRLNPDGFGQLVDFFGARKDLKEKKVRVLHDLSFVDDPTRIFRAVRFEQRLGFSIEEHTRALIEHALGLEMFAKTEKQRVRDEIILILSEPHPIKAISRMAQLHELRFIHPKMKMARSTRRLVGSVEEICRWYNAAHFRKRALNTWLMYFMALMDRLKFQEARQVCQDFVFAKGDAIRLLSFKRLGTSILKFLNQPKTLKPSHIYKRLEPLAFEVILLVMAKSKTQRVRRRITAFLTRYNGMKLGITGRDLQEMGLRPGPEFKSILTKALYAKLDGRVETKQDEINFARSLLPTS